MGNLCFPKLRVVFWLCIFPTFAAVALTPARGGERDEKIEAASLGNTTAIERLSQVSFLATVNQGDTETGKKYTVRYWRSGDKWRIKVKGLPVNVGNVKASMDLDLCSDGAEFRTTTRQTVAGGKEKVSSQIGPPRPIPKPTHYEVWGECMLSLRSKMKPVNLAEILRRGEVTKVDTDGSGPAAEWVFYVKRDGETIAYWVAPRYNFLIRRRVWSPGAQNSSESVVPRFHELEPGVYFPARVEVYVSDQGKKRTLRTVDYTEVALNKPHPPDIFTLKFPRGTALYDEIHNTSYDTDENGRPLGKVMTIPDSALIPLSPTDDSPQPLTETKEEPRSWTRFILPISAGILVFAAIAWLSRRRLRASESPPRAPQTP